MSCDVTCSTREQVAVDFVAILISKRVFVYSRKCSLEFIYGPTYLRVCGEDPFNSKVINKVANGVTPKVIVELSNHLGGVAIEEWSYQQVILVLSHLIIKQKWSSC